MQRLLKVVDRLTTPVLVVCALIVTGAVVRREVLSQRPAPNVAESSAPLPGGPVPPTLSLPEGTLIGNPGARVRLIEFADFECPFCARSAEMLHELMKADTMAVAIEFHHYPLKSHAHAIDAGNAAECANEQGRFEEFYFDVYSNRSRIGTWSWRKFAKRARVTDLRQFDECLQKARFALRVEQGRVAAKSLGINGTPAWIVRDSIFVGAPPRVQLEAWAKAR